MGPSRVALPLNEVIVDPVKVLWQTPASLPPIAKSTELRYFIPAKRYKFLFSHPPPRCLVVAATNERHCQGQAGPMPKAKNPKKLNMFG